jgi:hypothetical protein
VTLAGPRRLILAGAAVTVVGLAVAGTAPIVGTGAAGRIEAQQEGGGLVVIAGWALLALGIHRFGRLRDGRDEKEDERNARSSGP